MRGEFHANGKLLLSAEYLVLYGAQALALPVNKGQKLLLKDKANKNVFSWKANYNGNTWFFADFSNEFTIIRCSDTVKAEYLRKYLLILLELNPDFQHEIEKYDVETELEFDPSYGLGSSSTLISLLAQWGKCNPFDIHFRGSNGSAYDIACAASDTALLYELSNEGPAFRKVDFNPPFKEQLHFSYLGNKQDSQSSVAAFLKEQKPVRDIIDKISEISIAMSECTDCLSFGKLMKEHEMILSQVLETQSIKDTRFKDFPGEVKSLGAWGGDFIMLCSEMTENDLQEYLELKGIQEFYSFKDLEIK